MSDLFKDLMDKAKETLDPIVDRAKDVVESGELKDKANDVLTNVKDKAEELKDSAASGELKDKAADVLADVKEKAAPVIDKVMDAAGDVIDRVKDGVAQFASGEKPPLNVKNELFSKLDEEVADQKEAVKEQAAQMQKKIEEMFGKKE